MNGYKVFYREKTAEVQAETSYEAQRKYAAENKIKKAYEITVVLCEKDGEQITQRAGV